MRLFVIALLLAGLSMAFMAKPDYEDIQVTGSQNLPEMKVDLQVDCDSKEVLVALASGEDNEPVANGQIYLLYTDYAYQPGADGRTGADGVGRLVPMGKRDYLTDLFILRASHPQFRSTKIEFTYRRCFDAPPPQPPQANTTPQDQTGSTMPGTNATEPNGNASGGPRPPPAAPAMPCLPALALPLMALVRRWA